MTVGPHGSGTPRMKRWSRSFSQPFTKSPKIVVTPRGAYDDVFAVTLTS